MEPPYNPLNALTALCLLWISELKWTDYSEYFTGSCVT